MENEKIQLNDTDLAQKADTNLDLANGAGVHSKLGKFYSRVAQESSGQVESSQQVETYHQLLETLTAPFERYVNLAMAGNSKVGEPLPQDVKEARETLLATYAKVIDQAALLLEKNPQQAKKLINDTVYRVVEHLYRSNDAELIVTAGKIIEKMMEKKLPRSTDLLWNEENAFTDFYLKEYKERDEQNLDLGWYVPSLIIAFQSICGFVRQYSDQSNFFGKTDYFQPEKIVEAKNKLKKIWRILDERIQSHTTSTSDSSKRRGYYRDIVEDLLGEKFEPSGMQRAFDKLRGALAGISF